MKDKIIFASLLCLLCAVNCAHEYSYDCSYIANKTDAVHLTCGSASDAVNSHQNGCFFDLFTSSSNYTNRANVKMLQIHDNQCDTQPQRQFISKMFKSIQDFEYSYTMATLPLEDMTFERLQKLKVSHNYIESMGDFIGSNRNLREIYISYNILSSLSRDSLSKTVDLTIMNFSHNFLYDIDVDAFWPHMQLTILDLSFNDIQTLHTYAFGNNTKLKVLRLEGNRMKKFDCGLLLPLKNLQLIDAPFDQIEKLELNCQKCAINFHPDSENEIRLQLAKNELRFSKTNLQYVRYFNAAGCKIQRITEIGYFGHFFE